jgi:hypothetical protein
MKIRRGKQRKARARCGMTTPRHLLAILPSTPRAEDTRCEDTGKENDEFLFFSRPRCSNLIEVRALLKKIVYFD